jgi:hypothetical protein
MWSMVVAVVTLWGDSRFCYQNDRKNNVCEGGSIYTCIVEEIKMTNSVYGDSDADMVLVTRQIKKTCKMHGVKLSMNALSCLNELCKGLFERVFEEMKLDVERNKETAFNPSNNAPYEQLKQTWMGMLGVDHMDEELLPMLSKFHRVMELHWACMEKHVRGQGPVCCEEIRGFVEKMQVDKLMELVFGSKSVVMNWVSIGMASQHLDE